MGVFRISGGLLIPASKRCSLSNEPSGHACMHMKAIEYGFATAAGVTLLTVASYGGREEYYEEIL